MKEIEFNLLTEPWIRVRLRDNTVREVSQIGRASCRERV